MLTLYNCVYVSVERRHSKTITGLAREIKQPKLFDAIRRFLYEQIYPREQGAALVLEQCPIPEDKISVFYSAAATFYAPSDPSGSGGMRREHIRATPQWFKTGYSRFDCVLVKHGPGLQFDSDIRVAQVLLFFSIKFRGVQYQCVLVHWFETIANKPDKDTGMWIVRRAPNRPAMPPISVVRLDSLIRAAHLLPVYGRSKVPRTLKHYHSLDYFKLFYVNKFADHNAFEALHGPRQLIN